MENSNIDSIVLNTNEEQIELVTEKKSNQSNNEFIGIKLRIPKLLLTSSSSNDWDILNNININNDDTLENFKENTNIQSHVNLKEKISKSSNEDFKENTNKQSHESFIENTVKETYENYKENTAEPSNESFKQNIAVQCYENYKINSPGPSNNNAEIQKHQKNRKRKAKNEKHHKNCRKRELDEFEFFNNVQYESELIQDDNFNTRLRIRIVNYNGENCITNVSKNNSLNKFEKSQDNCLDTTLYETITKSENLNENKIIFKRLRHNNAENNTNSNFLI